VGAEHPNQQPMSMALMLKSEAILFNMKK